MGNMMGMFGGMGGKVEPDASIMGPLQPAFPAPDVIPVTPIRFKCRAKMTFSLFPVPMDTVLYYDFMNLRQRVEWQGGWEVERWDVHLKVKKSDGAEPEVTQLKRGDEMTSWQLCPFARFEGAQSVGGVNCHVYYAEFGGMMQMRTWTSIPEDKAVPPVLVYADVTMLGIRTIMHFTDVEPDAEMPASLFAVEQFVPPPPPPPVFVAGYVKDATTNRCIEGAQVKIGGHSATTDARGRFSIELHAGTFEVQYSAGGFVPLSKTLDVASTVVAGTFADACLSPQLGGGQMRFVLRWGSSPQDLDLYCLNADKSRVCWYKAREGAAASLNVDVRCGFGPETITVRDSSAPLAIWVHQFTDGGRLAGCGAVVDCYDASGHIGKVEVPAAGEGRWWHVLNINGGRIEEVGAIGNQ